MTEIPGCGGAKLGGAEAELGLLAQDEGLRIAGCGGQARLGHAVWGKAIHTGRGRERDCKDVGMRVPWKAGVGGQPAGQVDDPSVLLWS